MLSIPRPLMVSTSALIDDDDQYSVLLTIKA